MKQVQQEQIEAVYDAIRKLGIEQCVVGYTINAVIYVDPDLARYFLDRREEGNRIIRPSDVERYAKIMSDGDWSLNGETIKFNGGNNSFEKPKLVDGQHRMHAVAKSKETIPFEFRFYVSKDDFKTLDTGKNRTAGDVLTIFNKPQYPAQAAMATKLYVEYMQKGFCGSLSKGSTSVGSQGAKKMSNKKLIESYSDNLEISNFVPSSKISRQLAPQSELAFVAYLLDRKSRELGAQFMDALYNGYYEAEGVKYQPEVVWVLRDMLIGDTVSKHGRTFSSRKRIAVILKAFLYFRDNKIVKKINWNEDEKFPQI